MSQPAFCVYINTLCDGPVPSVLDGAGKPFLFESEAAAQAEIADNMIIRLEQFIAGEREFDDAMTVEEYVEAVDVLADGTVVDGNGKRY